ncbi:hypothetical protein J422_06553 [Methanocaldococcus villosus KIN24-T80]|uniref:TPR repeat-containing protein n=1 Tax=Methanocaldococcus villosus KIN24-T80 TaxID=1069083 RepID=N6UTL4_9EURY|nr:tetratricopeptide repeat protein [Methanocaldococcus villosus]ENN95669.1 hypothetical protein J422_06553 [Methanocaldococcus villosus KIN24-T80]
MIFKIFKKLFFLFKKPKFNKLIKKAEHHLDIGEYEKSIECYLEASKYRNLRPIDLANMAYAYYNIGNYNDALKCIDLALSMSPNKFEFLYLKGLILYKLKNFKEACKILEKACNKGKKSSDLLEILGEIFLNLEDYKKALKYFLKAYKLKPSKKNMFIIGRLYLLLGDIENAYEMFNKLLNIDPKHICRKIINDIVEIKAFIDKKIYNYIFKGLSYLEKKDYINALKIFNEMLSYEDDDFAHYYKSVISEIFEEYYKSLNYIDNSIQIIERSIFYAKKGDILRKLDSQRAIDAYMKSLEICENPYAYFGLALFYYKKDKRKAIKYFDNILEKYFEGISEDLMNMLIIYSLIGKGDLTGIKKFYEGALQYLDKIMVKYEDNPKCWRIKGYLFYKLNKYYDAEECFKKALLLDNNDVESMKFLIDIYQKLEKFDEAVDIGIKLKMLENNEKVEDMLFKLINNEKIKIDVKSPIELINIIYHKLTEVQYHFATLYRYVSKNPIKAFLYLNFIIDSGITKDLENIKVRKSLEEMLEVLKNDLTLEMFKYSENPKNYEPNKEILNFIRNKLISLGCI